MIKNNKKLFFHLLLIIILILFFFYGVKLYGMSASVPTGDSLTVPSGVHFLGTDDLGIDIYSQISLGFFKSMYVGLSSAFFSMIIGSCVGIISGLDRKYADFIFSFFINVFLCIPSLPVMVVLGAFFGQDDKNIIIIITMFSWAGIAKILREKVVEVSSSGYVKLSRMYGGSIFYIFKTHIAREVIPLIVISSISIISKAIIWQASLAFLGLCNPLDKSWGLMINRCISFKGIYFTNFWKWWLVAPCMSLIITIALIRLLAKDLEKILIK